MFYYQDFSVKCEKIRTKLKEANNYTEEYVVRLREE